MRGSLSRRAREARCLDFDLRVRDMEDGGMGSLEIDKPTSQESGRNVTVCRAAVQFTDADGVEVIASPNAREDGVPSS